MLYKTRTLLMVALILFAVILSNRTLARPAQVVPFVVPVPSCGRSNTTVPVVEDSQISDRIKLEEIKFVTKKGTIEKYIFDDEQKYIVIFMEDGKEYRYLFADTKYYNNAREVIITEKKREDKIINIVTLVIVLTFSSFIAAIIFSLLAEKIKERR